MKRLLLLALALLSSPCFAVFTKTYTVCESGCDYTGVQAAETAHAQNLVANDSALTFEIQNTWASPDVFWNISGWTMDATRFLTVTAVGAARATATWNSSAYSAERNFGSVIVISANFVRFDGIQSHSTATGGGAICFDVNSTNATIENCFGKGLTGTSTDGIDISLASGTGIIIRNNVIMDCLSIGIDVTSAAGGTKIDNNTLENCGTGIETDADDAIARNNIIWNMTTPLSGDFNTTTLSEENYTDAGSLSYGACGSCGPGDQVLQPDPFVAIGSENYNLASGATAIDAGKDLSADFTDAIGGKTRDALFDKGADEFIAAAGGGNRVLIRKAMMFWVW